MDGLDRIHKNRRINFCVDLSATPYFLARAGEDTNQIFPWVVSDFGLTDAIESGLVKIPQLAHLRPVGRGGGDVLQHLALDHEPALGRASAAASARTRSPRRCCARRRRRSELLAFAWDELRKAWEGTDEERPPVFILVCKNTKLASVIYEWLAEGEPPSGIPPVEPRLGPERGRHGSTRSGSTRR